MYRELEVTIRMKCHLHKCPNTGAWILEAYSAGVVEPFPKIVPQLLEPVLRTVCSHPHIQQTETATKPGYREMAAIRKSLPDRRPGVCRKFRFTNESLASLPPHPQECRSGCGEYHDTVVTGLICSVGRTGRKYFGFRYRYRHRKRMITFGEFPAITLSEARNKAYAARAMLAQDLDPAQERKKRKELPTLEEFATRDYLPFAKQHKRSWRDDELRLNKEILPRFGQLRIDMLTTREVLQFHNALNESRSPGTANRYLSLISRMYNLAAQWEIYEGNPARRVKKFQENNARQRFLSKEEVARFLEHVEHVNNPSIRNGLKLLLFSGMRKSEVFQLRWTSVNRDAGTLYLPETKSGKPRFVVLNSLARQIIEEMWDARVNAHPFVFPGRGPSVPVINPHKNFWQICRNAKLEGLRMHDLRHSFASLAVNAGTSLYDVQKLLGHTTPLMTQRYAHLEDASVRRASELVAQQISQSNGTARVVST